jgi:glycosyltransferase involved in cell wall biosynthesis
MAPKPRLAFVSMWDAADPNVESGYAFSMRMQLAARFDVIDVFPVAPSWQRLFLPLKVAFKAAGQYYSAMREPIVLRNLAHRIERRLRSIKPDLIFAPSSVPMTLVDTRAPLVIATDQVFASLLDKYVLNAAPRFRATGSAQEATALARATRISFPSEWAANEAVRAHGADPAKIAVIPWGANLSGTAPPGEVADAIAHRSHDRCRLTFVGRDWRRKGGDTVVETADILRRRGLPVDLTIIGCDPPLADRTDTTVHPWLDKHDAGQYPVFARAMLASHFFFLPSRAEAYGQAFCEAAAFGVPAIGSTEGGIPTIVREGITGFTRPADASPEVFADLIQATFEDRSRYEGMAHAARCEFEDRLNWTRFGSRLADTAEAALG